MNDYSYQSCLETAYRVNWRIDEILADQSFDPLKPWLPPRLSGADSIECLTYEEKIKLTHVEMGSYAHIFKYVEEFIAPKMTTLADQHMGSKREAYEALTQFAAEEIKHMILFGKIRTLINQTLGFDLKLIDGEKEVAEVVLGKQNLAVLLLIDLIEWFTQYHYLDAMRNNELLDPLTQKIFRAHWLEEAQHAKLDHLEGVRAFSEMNSQEKEQAIEDWIELVRSIDSLLERQAKFDVENLAKYLGRAFTEAESKEIYSKVLKTKRWVFFESGYQHPNFQDLYQQVTTPAQREKISRELGLTNAN